MPDASLPLPAQPPLLELERRQDEVLCRLDELDACITSLVAEFNQRLAESAALPQDASQLSLAEADEPTPS